jgi:hexosaminidase
MSTPQPQTNGFVNAADYGFSPGASVKPFSHVLLTKGALTRIWALCLCLGWCFMASDAHAQDKTHLDALGIIPRPLEYQEGKGHFTISDKTVIAFPKSLSNEAMFLAEGIKAAIGLDVTLLPAADPKPAPNTISFNNREFPKTKEAYRLVITDDRIEIEAGAPIGHFWGVQSLLHIISTQRDDGDAASRPVRVPCASIMDAPRYSWRSFMLDDSRSFHDIDLIKRYLDEMARLKLNVFHWHFIDNDGWRLEIKSFPRLTSIGAQSRGMLRGDVMPADYAVPGPYFYTQDQAREIIAYAARRHIRVIPEVEMPGHARAALKAYPEWDAGGAFKIQDPKVVAALKTILDEVISIFPDAVIHTGGDEARVRHQLEFAKVIEQHIKSRGRRMMYWADCTGLIPDEKSTILQYWMGNANQILDMARKKGMTVVNSSDGYTYLDYSYARLPLEKAYKFDPTPKGFESTVIGGGCQAWGEYMCTTRRRDYMVFPRLAAYAEVFWTERNRKDYPAFLNRLDVHKARWDKQGIYYARGKEIPTEQLTKEVISTGVKIGSWESKQVGSSKSLYSPLPSNDHAYDISKHVLQPGRYQIVLSPTKGKSRLTVRRAELYKGNTLIASDWAGMAGARAGMSGVFDLWVAEVDRSAEYRLSLNFFVHAKGKNTPSSDSAGDIYLKNIGDLPPGFTKERKNAVKPTQAAQ